VEIYKIENLSFKYPKTEDKALDNINMSVNKGEFITVCGKSGCGKTTLLRLMKKEIAPFGELSGNVWSINTAKVGFVMQNPENQIVTDKVWHELSFGLESMGVKNSEIRARVSEMASFFGIQNWFYKNTSELSGGQKQILNLASVMVMNPEVIILDEPTSQLDPVASLEFIKALEKINRELGVTVILSEHRLEETFYLSDRVIVMDDGKIIADNTSKEIGRILKELNHDMYSALPAPMRIYGAVEDNYDYPVTVKEGREWLENYSPVNRDLIPLTPSLNRFETAIELKDVWFRYEKNKPDIIKNLNLKVNKGEIFAILGGNGTGKTTALSLISEINTPIRGKVMLRGGKVGVLPQNPQTLFSRRTVYLELTEMSPDENKIKTAISLCHLESLLESHPYDLSGGEQQRVAFAKILLMSPDILLMDEPTKGFDAHFKQIFADIICDLKLQGVTVVMVSHDIEFCAEYADRCALFFDGNITSIGTPGEFFSRKSFYTTAANRMARTVIPNAVTVNDVILACGGKIKKRETKNPPEINLPDKNKKYEYEDTKKSNKQTLISMIILIFTIPATIFIGTEYFSDRKYYFISLLIILETTIPFFMLFEKRKPKAREIVAVSVMCGLAVAGRTVFYALPQFKPVVALIIISGLCFGGETGFLVGAMTAFISNFFFGQGPWTPWQMFAFGIIGFISGIIKLDKKKIPLCLFGFFVTLLIYGGIMNPASVIMSQTKITWKMILTSYLAGLPVDIVHALSTAIFLWFISEPMIEKIERIKIKYGNFC